MFWLLLWTNVRQRKEEFSWIVYNLEPSPLEHCTILGKSVSVICGASTGTDFSGGWGGGWRGGSGGGECTVFRHSKMTLVYWGSFGGLAAISQLLKAVKQQLSRPYVVGVISNDGRKLDLGQFHHFHTTRRTSSITFWAQVKAILLIKSALSLRIQ